MTITYRVNFDFLVLVGKNKNLLFAGSNIVLLTHSLPVYSFSNPSKP